METKGETLCQQKPRENSNFERWMGGWMDGWEDGWMDGWMDRQIDEWIAKITTRFIFCYLFALHFEGECYQARVQRRTN